MQNDIKDLTKLFIDIKNRGWIKSLRKGSTGIGYTFEKLINKEEEDFPIPDFRSIEIKTKNYNSKERMTLFSATPDGEIIFPIKEIYKQYGYYNRKNQKIFYTDVCTHLKYAGNRNQFRLHIDYKENKIKLILIEKNGNMKYTNISWSFKMLQEKLNTKIKNLAIVKAESKYQYGSFYYKYSEINFYQSKGFKIFLELIEKGYIKVTFKIGIYKTGIRKNEMNDHGTSFTINEKNIEKLYIKI